MGKDLKGKDRQKRDMGAVVQMHRTEGDAADLNSPKDSRNVQDSGHMQDSRGSRNVQDSTHTSPPQHEGFPWKHVIGFILSLVFTAIAFWFVLSSHLSSTAVIVSIVVLAIFQVLVQLLMFMHFTESHGKAYQVVAMLFGFFIAFTVVGGTIWIMAFKSIVA